MPGPGIADKTYLNLATPPHKAYNVEVAVAYTDGTWDSVFITIEDKPIWLVPKVAESRVIEQMAGHTTKVVAFARAIWTDEEPTENDMVGTVEDEEEIT